MTMVALGRRKTRLGRCINPVGSSAPEKTETRRAHSILFEQLPVLESYFDAGCDNVKSNAPGILQRIERRRE